MGAGGIHSVELIVLALLILVVAFAALAKRLETPYPIILVIGGLILSVIPHGPHVELDPEIVFLVILPPLLFSAAFATPWRDFRCRDCRDCDPAHHEVGHRQGRGPGRQVRTRAAQPGCDRTGIAPGWTQLLPPVVVVSSGGRHGEGDPR